MADGGKPLAEAKIKLSVEGAGEVRQEMEGVSAAAKKGVQDVGAFVREDEKFAKVNKELADTLEAEKRAVIDSANAKEVAATRAEGLRIEQERLTEAIRELGVAEAQAGATSGGGSRFGAFNDGLKGMNTQLKAAVSGVTGFLRVLGQIGLVVSVAVTAIAGLAKSIRFLYDELTGAKAKEAKKEAKQFLQDLQTDANGASSDIERLTVVMQGVAAQIKALEAEGKKEGFSAGITAGINELGKAYAGLKYELAEAEVAQRSYDAQVEISNDAAKARAQAESVVEKAIASSYTEIENATKALEEYNSAILKIRADGGVVDKEREERGRKYWESVIQGINDAAAAQKAADDKRAKDEADRAKEQEQRAKDQIAKEADARRKAADDEANARIRAQQSVFDAARRESERSLQAIAVTTAQATQLLRAINTSQSGGQPWQ